MKEQRGFSLAQVLGCPERVYIEITRREMAALYASPEKSAWAYAHYSTGLFSEGRPGIFGE